MHRAKVPYTPRTGRKASTTERTSWCSFTQAMHAYRQAKSPYDGLGIVLADGLAGIDLDHCRDPRTGRIEGWALAIIERVGCYAEVSPSGSGVHILFLGTVPPGGNKIPYLSGAVEMYASGRFFTVTGERIGDNRSLEARQETIDALHAQVFASRLRPPAAQADTPADALMMDDQKILMLARSNPDPAKAERFMALFDRGDISGYASQSEADLALANDLAYMCGPDAARIDALLQRSQLMRDKMERADYRARTIAKALAGRTAFYTLKNSGAAIPSHLENESPAPADSGSANNITDLAAALARIAQLEAENMQLVAQLAQIQAERDGFRASTQRMNEKMLWVEEVKELPKETMSQSEKDLLIGLQREFGWKHRANVRESGHYPTYLAELGEISGMGKSTVRTHLTALEKMGLVSVERYEVETSKGPRERIAVKMAPAVAKPKEYTRPDGPRVTPGGKREKTQCSACGSEDTGQQIEIETAQRKVLRITCHSDGCGNVDYLPLGAYAVVNRQIDTETAIPSHLENESDTPAGGDVMASHDASSLWMHPKHAKVENESPAGVDEWTIAPPPARPCIRCGAYDWRTRPDGNGWRCGSCQPEIVPPVAVSRESEVSA